MDITLDRKTNQDITFQYYESDGTTPRSLVGCTVFFTVKKSEWDTDLTDTTAVLKKTITSHTDDAAGLTLISLTTTDTYVTPRSYHYDIRVKEADDKVYKVQEGRCVVDGSPTNRTT